MKARELNPEIKKVRTVKINNVYHVAHLYFTPNFYIPITTTLCGTKGKVTQEIISNRVISDCPNCLEHIKNNTFVNFIGEVESKA